MIIPRTEQACNQHDCESTKYGFDRTGAGIDGLSCVMYTDTRPKLDNTGSESVEWYQQDVNKCGIEFYWNSVNIRSLEHTNTTAGNLANQYYSFGNDYLTATDTKFCTYGNIYVCHLGYVYIPVMSTSTVVSGTDEYPDFKRTFECFDASGMCTRTNYFGLNRMIV